VTRRRALLAAFALLSALPPAGAQEAAPAPRRRAQRPLPLPPAPVPPPELALGAPPTPPGFEPAPVPNRDLEPPRVAQHDGPSLSPSIIQRRLPGRGQAAEGSPSLTEERLFDPAPGARLRVPFSY